MKKHKPPKPPCKFLLKLGFLFFGNKFFKRKLKLIEDGTLKTIKPPFILVANHSSFADVASIVKMLSPNTTNFIASQTQYSRFGNILNAVGVLAKKQFTVQPRLIKDIKHILDRKGILSLFPEAKLSVDGTPNKISDGIAKLVKMLNATLVTVCFNGCYLFKPRWASKSRFVPVTAQVKVAVQPDTAHQLSVGEIHSRIVENLNFNDFDYQRKNNIEIDVPDLAEGLEGILFKCPNCHEEFKLSTKGNQISCHACGFSAKLNKFGVFEYSCNNNVKMHCHATLEMTNEQAPMTTKLPLCHCEEGSVADEAMHFCIDSIPDWNNFQKSSVKAEIQNNSYNISTHCDVEIQTKNKFKRQKGKAHLVHNCDGIFITLPNGNQLTFKSGFSPTLSFDNTKAYFPTEKATYRFVFPKAGISAKMNIAVEIQYENS